MKKLLLVVFAFLFTFSASSNAQTKELDSMRAAIDKHPAKDTTRVRLIRKYAAEAVFVNTSEMNPYLNDMISISQKENYKRGLQIAYSLQEVYFADRGDFPTAFLYADSAFAVLEGDTSIDAIIDKAILHHNLGIECFKLGDYEKAIDHYTKAANIFEKYKPKNAAVVYEGMAEVYNKLNQDDKSVEYDKKAIAIAEKYSTPSSVATKYLNYITRLIGRNQYKEAEELLTKIEPIIKSNNKPVQSFLYCESKGEILQHKKQFDNAISYFKQANNYAQTNEDIYQRLSILNTLAACLMDAGKLKESRIYLDTLLNESTSLDMKTYTLDAYTQLAKWYTLNNDFKNAYTFLNKKMLLSDSIASEETKEKISTMEVRYKVAGKDREIKSLQDEKQIQQLQLKQKNTLNYILIGAAVSILIISLLIFRNYKHRQKIQQQRITELETEKQLTATEAILKGEEQERSRLAKDLHDGLGGMLSGIKYSLSNMKENLIMTPSNAQAFEHSINMLDNSINEMRRVAHNLMPESLLKFGLDDALKDVCNEINNNGRLNVVYQSLGVKKVSLEQSLSVTVYRIVQELLNNIIKHADAHKAIVQVAATENQITITVEDDGKGMDTDKLKDANGIGWSNIQSRVHYHKGTVNIQSGHDKGTSVFIEFPTV